MTLVLASSSPTRQQMLRNAGLAFEVRPPDIDERAAEAPLLEAEMTPEDIAVVLAEVKARTVSEAWPGDLVIGADQTLDLDGERFTKPPDAEEARRQLLRLSGRTHSLHSAVACARAGEVLWRHVSTATLTMRELSPATVGRYVAAAGPAALASVGAYQVEGIGIQLFRRIDGDYFTVLGLPLLALLAYLRTAGILSE